MPEGGECGSPVEERSAGDALINTMNDLLVDALGAIMMSIVGYVSAKHRKGWVVRLLLKRTAAEA
ncbi:MAG: hypothetical protein MUC88_19175 [Planctomycetes bacterium]|nr:hypothetical protein [Planctomycetota bacterium]